jgi:hypothetical protein
MLEVGGGSGSIARWMSERIGDAGRVVVTDIDTRFLDGMTARNVKIRLHDIRTIGSKPPHSRSRIPDSFCCTSPSANAPSSHDRGLEPGDGSSSRKSTRSRRNPIPASSRPSIYGRVSSVT